MPAASYDRPIACSRRIPHAQDLDGRSGRSIAEDRRGFRRRETELSGAAREPSHGSRQSIVAVVSKSNITDSFCLC